jgi:dolichol-phosphate mannosyltransferase/undecaprenyl-phosphate 4-deoxy-4-formamido-L-arabinose transferase
MIMRRAIADAIVQVRSPNPLVGLLILLATERTETVLVEHHARVGRTTYSPRKLIRHFIHGIVYNSALPLRGVFVLGLLCLALSLGFGIFCLLRYLLGQITVPGWMTIVLLILFFSGMIMFSIGTLGEYLYRIIQEVQRIPQYVIREKDL